MHACTLILPSPFSPLFLLFLRSLQPSHFLHPSAIRVSVQWKVSWCHCHWCCVCQQWGWKQSLECSCFFGAGSYIYWCQSFLLPGNYLGCYYTNIPVSQSPLYLCSCKCLTCGGLICSSKLQSAINSRSSNCELAIHSTCAASNQNWRRASGNYQQGNRCTA